MRLDELPIDLLLHICSFLNADAIASLSKTSHSLHTFVESLAWRAYSSQKATSGSSLRAALAYWQSTPRLLARYAHLTDGAWRKRVFVARPLGSPWQRWQRPVISLQERFLITSCGPDAQVFDFDVTPDGVPRVHPGRMVHFPKLGSDRDRGVTEDISGIVPLPNRDGTPSSTIVVARTDGTLFRASIPETSSFAGTTTAIYSHPRTRIKSLSSSSNYILSFASNGLASLYDAYAPWKPAHTISLHNRGTPWSSLLVRESATSYAALGTSYRQQRAQPTSPTADKDYDAALSIHPIISSSLSTLPLAILGDGKSYPEGNHLAISARAQSSAAYALARPSTPISSTFAANPSVLISGWYDGCVRIHDFRSSSSSSPSSSSSLSRPLDPILTMTDPMTHSGAIYALDVVENRIFAGTAVHGVISIWDVRSVATTHSSSSLSPQLSSTLSRKSRLEAHSGWSLYPPRSDFSPTYTLKAESSRIWGAGQYGAWVVDFGPNGVYPDLDSRVEGRWREDGKGMAITMYEHTKRRVVDVRA